MHRCHALRRHLLQHLWTNDHSRPEIGRLHSYWHSENESVAASNTLSFLLPLRNQRNIREKKKENLSIFYLPIYPLGGNRWPGLRVARALRTASAVEMYPSQKRGAAAELVFAADEEAEQHTWAVHVSAVPLAPYVKLRRVDALSPYGEHLAMTQ